MRSLPPSAAAGEQARFLEGGTVSFSRFFWRQIVNGASVHEAFQVARRGMVFSRHGQSPQMDDNGNGVGNESWGSVHFTFSDCGHGTVDYAGPTAYGSGRMSLQRLTAIAGLDCSRPPGKISLAGGLSGSYYDARRDGEGLLIEVLPENQALVYWFTYDQKGQQAWLNGLGHIEGGDITVEKAIITSSGRFGEGFDPTEVERWADSARIPAHRLATPRQPTGTTKAQPAIRRRFSHTSHTAPHHHRIQHDSRAT